MNNSPELTRRTILGSLVMASAAALETTLDNSVASAAHPGPEALVQTQKVLTVSEGKKLIARAIVRFPLVQKALQKGLVIIAKGTTTTYIAKEILKTEIPHGSFVIGSVYPEKGGKKLTPGETLKEIILVDGQRRQDVSLEEAVKQLRSGDVVLKGANALNYRRQLAAGLIGVPSPSAGTTGKIIPAILGTKAHLIIPVGLEKEIGGNMVEIVKAMQTPATTLGDDLSMVLYSGILFTEIEALRTLTGVSALHVASGGIGGAEGSTRLLLRGSEEQVKKALEIIADIQGEPPFVH